ncbi:MAG: thioredoxin-dependent thiol peroxidase [Lentimicrobiaceae bacterium]|jgi:peroxiredoxin Q/BCP|nr:thioredoxin-dependent thiol peroxidase [Lentimicrobiaceae bacterium]MBT3454263.1 thioredoxin-dependent thiol peroxidase [Lentimicrobiaceae bacterium]MBT3817861.1 thioredoxin-dependent thiol peroxidase [Lentimicrobiaceae bacterium]MBT4191240.1 thioredoxin-dependent thiol peroxidase [Lentimicrobiaceae bacterium]MBT5162428.1 thioredoxin-dependent thiol peroxidase [Lentimicrobiaceae bacterium]
MQLNIGDKAPDFKGVDQNGKSISLSDFKGKNLIMYFYPKDNTPGCTAEACDLRDNYEMWIERGYAVVGVSPDSEQSHKKFIDKYDLPFPLIADTDKTIIKDFGAWGLKKLYGREYEGLLRTTFVIDATGIITNIFTKVKTKDHTNQILESLK